MRVIYLAAGESSRMRPYANGTHKCLLEVQGKSVVEHFLDSLIRADADISTVHLVVGHNANKFKSKIGPFYPSRHAKGRLYIRYVRNPLYKVTGAAHSLYCCRNTLKRGRENFLILEGDHYLHPKLIERLIHSPDKNAVLVDENIRRVKWDEETMAYGYEGLIKMLKWLPPYPPHAIGEAATVFKLGASSAVTLSILLENYLLQPGQARKEIIDPINQLIELHPMRYVTTGGLEWTEIDFPRDLEYARKMDFS